MLNLNFVQYLFRELFQVDTDLSAKDAELELCSVAFQKVWLQRLLNLNFGQYLLRKQKTLTFQQRVLDQLELSLTCSTSSQKAISG